MKQHSEHLSDAQIEHYGETGIAGHAPEGDRELEQHLAECSLCSERVLSAHRLRFALVTDPPLKGSSQPAASTPDCPEEDILRELAAGTCPPEQAAKIGRHASHCDHCGPILRNYIEDFSGELKAEDQALLKEMKSSTARSQKVLTRRMLADSGKAAVLAKRFSWRWVLAPTALAASAFIAFAVWYQQRETPEKVEKLLAHAYTEQRTMEMRLPGAAHSAFRQKLSGDTESRLNSPDSLRKATDEIVSRLKKTPDDPNWLLLSAELDILDWHYEAALRSLTLLDQNARADTPKARMVRSLALYEKAEVEHDVRSYGEIVDLLGKTLKSNPDDTIALFNQAVACENLHMYECASSDYERFLKSEKDQEWASEARDRLKRIQGKKNFAL